VSSTTPTELSAAAALESPARDFTRDVWRRFRTSPGALVGAVVVALIALVAIAAPLIAPDDPLAQNLALGAHAPSAAHWFGTDKLGRDVFARIVYGARISIRIGFVAVGLAITIGTFVGLIAGYAGKRTEAVLMGAMDLMLAFPSIILAIGITTILGPSIVNLMIAVGIVYVPQYARLARSSVLAVKENEYIEFSGGTSCPTSWHRCSCKRHSASRPPSSKRPASRISAWARGRRRRSGARCSTTRAIISSPRRGR
jgi:ABC-type dipeptide/oligopeptide/nickel transport system permease subunit